MSAEKMLNIIHKGKKNENQLADLVFGVVTQTNPLEIRVENRLTLEILLLGEDFLKVASWLRPGTTNGQALRVGDQVTMIRYQNGNRFYVIDKEEWHG